ncbi:MAG: SDR family oxidoreductase [Planctomycetota bacterium]|jgi:all-trans-retinol dehydrogenase (NAD+)
MSEIAGSNILITGGAGGIGRLTALKLAKRGGNVIVWDVDADGLARVVDELASQAARPGHGYVCNVADRRCVYDAAAKVRREVGPVDILINNAGVVSGKPFLDCTDDEIARTVGVNTMGLFWTTKTFLPDMIRRGRGHLVTVASAAGVIGVAGLADYCASKWAAVGFNESIRQEVRKIAPKIRTTVACPYFVDTDMFHGVRTRFRFLLPVLKADHVAERIVGAIRRNRRRVVMPWLIKVVPLLRTFSLPLLDAAADCLGINRAMDRYAEHAEAERPDEETS